MENLTFNWVRVKNDVNGNPRYVVHFLAFKTPQIDSMPFEHQYNAALALAREIGGRKFHNKQYGGGIVFQSYNLRNTEQSILNLLEKAKNV